MDNLAEHEAFLRAIFDVPEDDLPRLVYADFLEENGEPDRAALVRVQVEAAGLVKQGAVRGLSELRGRESELLDRLHPELRDWQPGDRDRVLYDRGFLTERRVMICPGDLDDAEKYRQKIVRSRPH